MKNLVRFVKGLIVTAAIGICLIGFLATFAAPAFVATENICQNEPAVTESVLISGSAMPG